MIFGFDLGRSTGFAWCESERVVASERWDFTKWKPSALLFPVFWENLVNAFGRVGPQLVAFEEPSMAMSTAWSSIFYGQRALLILMCEQRRVPWVPVHPSEWKKAAGLPGNAGKPWVKKAAAERWVGLYLSQDEIDARFIALAGRLAVADAPRRDTV